jgi:hypothetical protein
VPASHSLSRRVALYSFNRAFAISPILWECKLSRKNQDSAPPMTESWSLPHVPSWPFSVVLRSPIYSIALGPEMSTHASAESHLCTEGSEFQCRRSLDVCLFSRSIRTFSLPSIMKLPLILLALVAGAYLPTRRNRDSHELSRC